MDHDGESDDVTGLEDGQDDVRFGNMIVLLLESQARTGLGQNDSVSQTPSKGHPCSRIQISSFFSPESRTLTEIPRRTRIALLVTLTSGSLGRKCRRKDQHKDAGSPQTEACLCIFPL